MKTINKYHIDVTPEEDMLFREKEYQSNSSKKNFFKTKKTVFFVVLGHILITAVITGYAIMPNESKQDDLVNYADNKPKVIEQKAEDKVKEQIITTENVPKIEDKPVIKPVLKPVNVSKPLTKTYAIKKGDTLYSISKKYKLDTKKLMHINSIKDPTKIQPGQIIKLM